MGKVIKKGNIKRQTYLIIIIIIINIKDIEGINIVKKQKTDIKEQKIIYTIQEP